MVSRACHRQAVGLPAFRLPGRSVREVFSRRTTGSEQAALRLVAVDPFRPDSPRHPHVHRTTEEVIYVLSGTGTSVVEGERFGMRPGDALWVPPGARHMTVASGKEPLQLLCFFPTAAPEEDTMELPDVVFALEETERHDTP